MSRSSSPFRSLFTVAIGGLLVSGCALGPWYAEREERESLLRPEHVSVERAGSRTRQATISRLSRQLQVHVLESAVCEERGEKIETSRVFETRDYNGMLAFEGTLAGMGIAVPLLIPSTGGQRLIGLALLGLPLTTVFTVELLRPTHRERYRESEPTPYSYTRRCPSSVLSSVLVEVERADGTKQSARTNAEGIARFAVDPKQSVTVRVEGVGDQVSPAATATPDAASE